MTDYTYKIIIFGNGLYREIQLKDEFSEFVRIGTTKNCKVRFDKDKFFEDFEIEIFKEELTWNVSCYNSIYIDSMGVIKTHSMELMHGSEITFKYENSNVELFKISYLIDFDDQEFDFNKVIDISSVPSFEIGSKEYHTIFIGDSLVGNDSITLTRQGERLIVNTNDSKYGVYINGRKADENTDIVCPYDFIMLDGYYFYYKEDKLFTSAKRNIISKLPEIVLSESKSQFAYPKFNRNVRMQIVIPDEKIVILPPKELGEPPEKNLAMSLVPSIVSLVAMMLMRSMMGGNKMFLIYCGLTMGMGIITSILTYIQQGKKYRTSVENREIEYTDYIKKQEEKIKELRKKEKRILSEKYIDIDSEVQRVLDFAPGLFEKNKQDDDYLVIRIGEGEVEANCEIDIKEQEFKNLDDKIADYPTILKDSYQNISQCPITIDFKECNGIGVVGDRIYLFELLASITVDIVTRHFYDDVKLYYIFSEEDMDRFMPLRWLKHVSNSENSIRNFMYNDESKKVMMEYLYKELSRRDSMKTNMIENEARHIIFVYDSDGFAKHPVSTYVERGKDLGFTFIFLEEYQEYLPEHIDYVVYLEEKNKGKLVDVKNKESVKNFEYKDIKEEELESICLKMACIDVDGVSLENNLTSSISLFKLLGIMSISDIDLGETWKNSQIYKTMAAPLGVNANNEIIYLDLNEKKHGPHGLVAGTTGSGKSEILQSYILSMALHYHPYEVGFVIIDFKGGGMVNQFKNLPHLIGAITNIDGREIERSLLSIRAELKKRQSIFAEYNVNHIDNYIKLFKSGKAKKPLPHLILIVDEFAELKNEHSDFMKELISAARIGRSLGVHLILATQKPSGVVDNQIWSNSKFKLCLKVQDKNDSNEVLKSPLAAEIKEPGRAYLQVGNNEIFELFQSAFSGADVDEQQAGKIREYDIAKLNLAGIRDVVFRQENKKKKESKNQLEVTVEYISEYCRNNKIEQLQGICLPSLGEVINYEYIPYNKNESIGMIPGIYDDPDNQLQSPYELNLSMNHVFILGSSQYGKTNFLQTIIKGLANEYSPEQINIYILDFASMILKNLSDLKHVGGVVTASDDEKIKHFFRMMNQEIAYRKSLLADLGISSFSSYLEAGYNNLTQIIIAIDNFTALKELYLQKEDYILPICREGLSVGISIVCTDSQSSGLGYKYLSNFSKKVALFTNNEGEYNNLFGFCRMKNRNIPGRAIVEVDKALYEFQAFLAFEGEKEIERVHNMKSFVEEINNRYGEVYAKKIPEIPKIFTKQYAVQNFPNKLNASGKVLFGINCKTVEAEVIDLNELDILGIVGKPKQGKANFVKNIIMSLEQNKEICPFELYITDDIMGKYSDFGSKEYTKTYSVTPESVIETIDEIEGKLKNHFDELSQRNLDINSVPYRLVVIQNRDAIDVISKSKEAMDRIKNIVGKYKDLKATIIFSNLENTPVAFASPEILKLLKEKKRLMIFEDLNAFKFMELPSNYVKEFQKPIGEGEGYYLTQMNLKKFKFLKV